MSTEHLIALCLALTTAAIGAVIWLTRTGRTVGNEETAIKTALAQIPEQIRVALLPLVAQLDALKVQVAKFERKLEDEDRMSRVEAREAGQRDSEFRRSLEQLEEVDKAVERIDKDVRVLEGDVKVVRRDVDKLLTKSSGQMRAVDRDGK